MELSRCRLAEYFRLLGTNSFHVKAKNERFTAAGSRCRNYLKYENLTTSFGRLRQKIALKSVLHVQHDYFPSFNQLITNEFSVSFLKKTQPLLPPLTVSNQPLEAVSTTKLLGVILTFDLKWSKYASKRLYVLRILFVIL